MAKPTKRTKPKTQVSVEPPKPVSEVAEAGFDSADILERIDKVEGDVRHWQRVTEFVADTNKFIIVVLFVGFLVLLVAVLIAGISAISSDSSSRAELTNTVEQLNAKIDSQNSSY